MRCQVYFLLVQRFLAQWGHCCPVPVIPIAVWREGTMQDSALDPVLWRHDVSKGGRREDTAPPEAQDGGDNLPC
ncbi:hypothetical protein E2C01_100039 [Portunus trituberculatus]|uniref:Secreted protein n=1 Tax=Portunus trituberculatus TaxID=210409 RepID=A0A5B7KGE2_PORTR|nr:hypothetical protein [Portunus trituberculatus]